ncbi:MAG: maltotransferase domain-containing protein, partial [Caulobacteraceae bacterium]
MAFNAILLSLDTLGQARAPTVDDSAVARVDADHITILAALAEASHARGLRLLLDWSVNTLVFAQADAYRQPAAVRGPIDPRHRAPPAADVRTRLGDPELAEIVNAQAAAWIIRLTESGVDGLRLLQPDGASPAFWRSLISASRANAASPLFIAETQGVSRANVEALAGCGFDALTSSLTWWDGRSRWFVEEYEALRTVAPLIAEVEPPFGARLAQRVPAETVAQAYAAMVKLAAATGSGLLIPMGFEAAAPEPLQSGIPVSAHPAATDLVAVIRDTNAMSSALDGFTGEMRMLSGEGAAVTALLRADTADVRQATRALLILINSDLQHVATVDTLDFLVGAGADFQSFTRYDDASAPLAPLAPGEVRLLVGNRARPITGTPVRTAVQAAQRPRLVVEALTPRVDGGAFPVRRVVGEPVTVQADIFADGHEHLAADLRWRSMDETAWCSTPMTALGNDLWEASFTPDRLGRYVFAVQGWLDAFAGFQRDFAKKIAANVATAVDVAEGRKLIEAAAARSAGYLQARLTKVLADIDAAAPADRPPLLSSLELAALMRAADDRPYALESDEQILDAERLGARFANWYELFPRSITDDVSRHGTFDDVIARLPAVRAMGFDVLYFPPIHPIGKKNRKGRNNTLTPGPDDPGSPYAIGSEAGGHDAIQPELGTLEDFRRLVAAASAQGLEIALDFAVQCSPDHPWLKQHPGWFDWRPDGSIKYAENPPKRYEDIVNVDFYKPDAVPDLWLALRDIVLLWIEEGVRLFRVDNPHTKPLPFWEWMIADVRSRYPDVVFLAEAFTRPKVMYRLAKIGFSQSYTYFTWRNSKAEFIEYLTELTTTAPKEFYRPHFFVNTPDINPYFLQTSGRAGFLIRAALAATLSGL